MNLKEYWEKRAEMSLKSVGQKSYSEELNRMETEILFDTLSKEVGVFLNGKRILDIGCGIGRVLSFYSNFSSDVFGVDFSTNMLNICKNNVTSAKLVNGDACSLPFRDECFDLVSAIVVLQHIINDTKRECAIKEMIRILKPKGVIIINEEILKSFEIRRKMCKLFGYDFKEQTHVRYWSEDRYISLLKKNKIKVKRVIKSREMSFFHYLRFLLFIVLQGTYILIRYRKKPSEKYLSSRISGIIDRFLLNKVVFNCIKQLSRLMPSNKCDSILIVGERA